MKDISRRRLLAVGLLGRTVTLAGCLGRSSAEHTPESTAPDREARDQSSTSSEPDSWGVGDRQPEQ
ncbi:hypothetical protein [Halomarina oriensis]|uniref:Uncharacterized protein n=1 Tax=Halomarina oriensis TaxID=671145 RepID=A0A6B0GPG1_9EURY|nr:hypothetical protein [Halomarina oriensis]MWG36756.1 hypothetical protein [Halomarina oriensis]